MTWNVVRYDINKGTFTLHNVLAGREDIIRKLKSKSKSIDEFSKELRSEMMYHYWRRAEWEILISPLCGRSDNAEQKVDVFDQLTANWDRFVDYCWSCTKQAK